MKIRSLPKGAEHGLKGQTVLVPSNVQHTVLSLRSDIRFSNNCLKPQAKVI